MCDHFLLMFVVLLHFPSHSSLPVATGQQQPSSGDSVALKLGKSENNVTCVSISSTCSKVGSTGREDSNSDSYSDSDSDSDSGSVRIYGGVWTSWFGAMASLRRKIYDKGSRHRTLPQEA